MAENVKEIEIHGRFDLHVSFNGVHTVANQLWFAVAKAVDETMEAAYQPGESYPSRMRNLQMGMDLDEAEVFARQVSIETGRAEP